MDWFNDLQRWAGGGAVGMFVYFLLKWREQSHADERGDRADDLSERRHEVESFREYSKELNEQWQRCLQRCGELEHENRQLQTRLLGYSWMESGKLDPQALRKLAAEMEAKELPDGE